MQHNVPVLQSILFSLLTLIMLILTGCGSQTSKPSIPIASADTLAKELYQSKNFSAAAEEYLKLVKSKPDDAIKYQLGATDALIKDNEIDQAQQILKLLSQTELNNVQLTLKKVFNAQIHLAKEELETAYSMLNTSIPSETPRLVFAKFYDTRAIILHRKKEYFAAANERLFLNSYLDDAQAISKNYQSLWQSLSRLSPDELNSYRFDNDGILTSWLELCLLYQTMLQNTDNLEAAIATWQQRYPDHPALNNIIPTLIESSKKISKKPLQVALLLPFSSKYNNASIAIREGFMAAWYESRDDKPIIKIYDTDTENVVEIYQQAITEGAEFIVGPLQKSAIANLIENSDITVTTLVLNQYDGKLDNSNASKTSILPTIIQFGLSPEEETRQVAERAWFDGHARAISISTRDERGQRINDTFTTHWQALGGTVLEQVNISLDNEELANHIKTILNVNDSEQRSKALRVKLQRSLKTEVRRRQDIDLIFMAVPPTIARQLVPQLRYYRIEDIALYSISDIYTGTVNTRADADINDVLFIDMPWVIDPENEYSPLNRMIERYRKPAHANYKRLYAFGIDAYHLIPQFSELVLQTTQQYEGKTGQIKLDKEGVVHRRLIWARFTNGKPELSDTNLN